MLIIASIFKMRRHLTTRKKIKLKTLDFLHGEYEELKKPYNYLLTTPLTVFPFLIFQYIISLNSFNYLI